MTNELIVEQEPATSLAGTEQPFGGWLEEPGQMVHFRSRGQPIRKI